MVRLDIISDPVCPWCFVGQARLRLALEQQGEPVFDIRWRPFRLNPDIPPEGFDRVEYLAARYGAGSVARMSAEVAALGAAVGLDIRFDRATRIPDTLDAHRLILWAGEAGVQDAVVQRLFTAYFTLGADISDRDLLCDVAAAAGMDAALTARHLEAGTDRAEVLAAEAASRRFGVTAVPSFVIDGRYMVQGAQDVATWGRLIGQVQGMALSEGGEA